MYYEEIFTELISKQIWKKVLKDLKMFTIFKLQNWSKRSSRSLLSVEDLTVIPLP